VAAAAHARAPRAQSRACTQVPPDPDKAAPPTRLLPATRTGTRRVKTVGMATTNYEQARDSDESTTRRSLVHGAQAAYAQLPGPNSLQKEVQTAVRKNTCAVFARATERRRRHVPHHARARVGHADGTAAGRRVVHRYTLQCSNCGALVDMRSAKVTATIRKHGRQHNPRALGVRYSSAEFSAGDGCASASCSSDYRAAEFKRRQRAMARQISDGSRILIAWPRDTHDTEFWQRPDEATAHAAARAAQHT